MTAPVALRSTVIRNSFLLAASQFAGKALTFVSFILMARLLGELHFGEMSFALSYTGLFLVIGYMGLDTIVIRNLAQETVDPASFISDALSLRTVLTIVAFALTVASSVVLSYPAHLVVLVIVFGVASYFDQYSKLMFAVFRAHQNMRIEAMLTIAEKAMLLTGLVLCTVFSKGIIAVGVIYAAANGVKLVVALVLMRRNHRSVQFRYRPAAWGRLLKESFPFAAVFVFWSISYRIDQVMLEHLRGVGDVGLYGAAYRIIETLTFLPEAVGSALMPAVASTVLLVGDRALAGVRLSLRFLLFLSIGIATIGTFFADVIIPPLLGARFSASAPLFAVLVWSLVFIFAEFVTAGTLASAHAQRKLILITCVCMCFNIAANLVLIPAYGPYGAAVSTIATEALNIGMAVLFLRVILKASVLEWRLLAFPAAGAGMALVFALLKPVHWTLALAAGLAVYPFLAWVFRGITSDDARIARTALAFRRPAVVATPATAEDPS
jgi:O-antigen/teichoic acid export membrane protein